MVHLHSSSPLDSTSCGTLWYSTPELALSTDHDVHAAGSRGGTRGALSLRLRLVARLAGRLDALVDARASRWLGSITKLWELWELGFGFSWRVEMVHLISSKCWDRIKKKDHTKNI